MPLEKVRKRINELEYEYTLDQRELAKILIIASTTMLLFSVHVISNLQEASASIDSADQKFAKVKSMVSSEDYNQSIQALQDIQEGSISQRMQYAASFFNEVQDATYSLSKVESTLDGLIGTYRWIVLISILGEVAGVSLIYM
ncbi:MAG: hypothetical protein ABEJ36_01485 [Candidatus Nanosalina sp.]